MAKNRDKKKKDREKRVAKKKLAEAAKRRADRKSAEDKKSGSVISKNISSAADAKTKYEESTKLPRKLGG